MNSVLINVIVGYFVIINIIGISLIWLKKRTKFIKLEEKKLNIVLVILSAIGGFIGVLVGNEMIGYDYESKLFKRLIPLIIFIEVCIAIYIIYTRMQY